MAKSHRSGLPIGLSLNASFCVSNETPKLPSDTPRQRVLFRPRATTFFRVVIAVAGLLLVSSAYALFQYYHSPYWNRIGLAPDQPVQFSHRHHASELRIDCRFCHATVEISAFAGMPTTQTCLNCHSQLFTDTAMLRPVVQSAATNKPLQWTRVTRLPDHVYFNHSIHVSKGVSCTSCHGDLGRMALTAKAKPLDMRWCLDCHRDPVPRLQSRETLFAPIAFSSPTKISDSDIGHTLAAPPAHLTNCSTCHH